MALAKETRRDSYVWEREDWRKGEAKTMRSSQKKHDIQLQKLLGTLNFDDFSSEKITFLVNSLKKK